jgi:hypothetical protein
MIRGFVTISKILDDFGREISTQTAVDNGLIVPSGVKPRGWGIEKHEVPLSYNFTVDNCRQMAAYLLGGRSPAASWSISQFGLGTGTVAPNAANTSLQSAISFYNPGSGLQATKPVDTIDFPAPFVARVQFTIAAGEANGLLISEMGLFTSGGILLARKTNATPIAKNSGWSPTFLWRVRC